MMRLCVVVVCLCVAWCGFAQEVAEEDAITSLGAGSLSSCYIEGSDGVVWCWGSNEAGEVGQEGSDALVTSPSRVEGLKGVQQLAGDGHMCAVTELGEVWCWGLDRFGQVGDGEPGKGHHEPSLVEGLSGRVVQVDAGGEHSCAVLAGGAVMCWGSNKSGQLGDGTTRDSAVPVAVKGLVDAVQVSCGGGANGQGHSCAVRKGGKVQCWGNNEEGQLGNKSTRDASRPVLVNGMTDAKQVALGRAHSCALHRAGGVSCWGSGASGRLGDKLEKSRSVPGTVRGVKGALKVAVGAQHSCALLESGAVMCWGDNAYGQAGSGSKETSHAAAVRVEGVEDAVDIALGWDHGCVLLRGAVWCWGDNAFGQLGNGTSGEPSRVPVAVQRIKE